MITKYITKYKLQSVRIPTFAFSNVCMQIKLVNILTYVPILSDKKWRHNQIIPFGTRYNIQGRWQPRHQWELFHWSIVDSVQKTSTYHNSRKIINKRDDQDWKLTEHVWESSGWCLWADEEHLWQVQTGRVEQLDNSDLNTSICVTRWRLDNSQRSKHINQCDSMTTW